MSGKTRLNLTMEDDRSGSPSTPPKKGIVVDNEVLQNIINISDNIDRIHISMVGLRKDVKYQKDAQLNLLEEVTSMRHSLDNMNSRVVKLEEGHRVIPCDQHSRDIVKNSENLTKIDKRLVALETRSETKEEDNNLFKSLVNTKIGLSIAAISMIITAIGVIASIVALWIQSKG